jgi:hypothetical protein
MGISKLQHPSESTTGLKNKSSSKDAKNTSLSTLATNASKWAEGIHDGAVSP